MESLAEKIYVALINNPNITDTTRMLKNPDSRKGLVNLSNTLAKSFINNK
jgi:hypothetical protein